MRYIVMQNQPIQQKHPNKKMYLLPEEVPPKKYSE